VVIRNCTRCRSRSTDSTSASFKLIAPTRTANDSMPFQGSA
jgi:hypothetical protein